MDIRYAMTIKGKSKEFKVWDLDDKATPAGYGNTMEEAVQQFQTNKAYIAMTLAGPIGWWI